MVDVFTMVSLAGVATLAGFIDAIAGGGGLLTLPALLLSGIAPVEALATNKMQGTAGSSSAALTFIAKGYINFKKGLPIALFAYTGGLLGALLVSQLPKEKLQLAIPFLLVAVAIYLFFSPKMSNEEKKAKMPLFVFAATVVSLIGFYDGILGPGTGSFYMIAFISLLGYGVIKAISYTKLANMFCNLGALSVFAFQGHIILPIAIVMAVGALVGAQLGSRFAIKYGTAIVKPMLIIMSLSMAAKLIWQQLA